MAGVCRSSTHCWLAYGFRVAGSSSWVAIPSRVGRRLRSSPPLSRAPDPHISVTLAVGRWAVDVAEVTEWRQDQSAAMERPGQAGLNFAGSTAMCARTLSPIMGRSRRGTAKCLKSDARNPTVGSLGGGVDHVAPHRPRKNLHLSFSFMRTDSTVGGLRMNHSCRLLFAAIVGFFVPSCSSSTSVAPTTTDAPENGSITDDASTQGEVDAASDSDGGGGRGGTGGSNGSTT